MGNLNEAGYEIGGDWVNVHALTGSRAGARFLHYNSDNDIEYYEGDSAPSAAARGIPFRAGERQIFETPSGDTLYMRTINRGSTTTRIIVAEV